jgi:hypothetical protein
VPQLVEPSRLRSCCKSIDAEVIAAANDQRYNCGSHRLSHSSCTDNSRRGCAAALASEISSSSSRCAAFSASNSVASIPDRCGPEATEALHPQSPLSSGQTFQPFASPTSTQRDYRPESSPLAVALTNRAASVALSAQREERALNPGRDCRIVAARAVRYLLLLRLAAHRKQKRGPTDDEPVRWLSVRGSSTAPRGAI